MTSLRRRFLDEEEVQGYDHVAPGVLSKVRLVRSRLLPPAIDGLTLGRFVFLRGDRIDRRESELIAHELVHVRQFAELGAARFLTRYVLEYLRNLLSLRSHREAYRAISFEVEARREAAAWVRDHSRSRD